MFQYAVLYEEKFTVSLTNRLIFGPFHTHKEAQGWIIYQEKEMKEALFTIFKLQFPFYSNPKQKRIQNEASV